MFQPEQTAAPLIDSRHDRAIRVNLGEKQHISPELLDSMFAAAVAGAVLALVIGIPLAINKGIWL